MNEEIMVSVIMPTYGHEKYISHAIESVLMQKVNFRYEILIGEDASPDNTKDIIKKYEDKYSQIIRAFYREKNTYKHPEIYKYGNSSDLKLKAKGKYIITLEGDDYWIESNKLQLQVEFLEKRKEYIAVAHNTLVVDENEEKIDMEYPECKDSEYTIRHFASEIMAGQTATILYRNFYKERNEKLWFLLEELGPGDRRLLFYLLGEGKVACIQRKMSAYRYVVSGGLSYSATYKLDPNKIYVLYKSILEYAYENYRNNKMLQYAEMIYYRWIYRMYREKRINRDVYRNWKSLIKNPVRAKYRFALQLFNRIVLKKKVFA